MEHYTPLERITLYMAVLFGSVTTSIVAILLGYLEVTWVNIIGAVILSVVIVIVMILPIQISRYTEYTLSVGDLGPVSIRVLSYLPTITTISVGYILKMVTIREALVVYTIVSILIFFASYQLEKQHNESINVG